MLAADVDFQSRLQPNDRLEVLFSQRKRTTAPRRIRDPLRQRAFRRQTRAISTASRCRTAPSTISTRTAAARASSCCANPVPNGTFRSGFGMRRHPILGYSRMHTGVDWAAPRGTPIIAAGNGTVEKAGWSGGYGRQTIIRHPNGYESSYNHQNAIASGVVPGGPCPPGSGHRLYRDDRPLHRNPTSITS